VVSLWEDPRSIVAACEVGFQESSPRQELELVTASLVGSEVQSVAMSCLLHEPMLLLAASEAGFEVSFVA
jgi:hypothetical protein